MTTIKDSINLSGYTIDFTGPTHNGYNDITTSILVTLDSNANPLIVSVGDRIVDASYDF